MVSNLCCSLLSADLHYHAAVIEGFVLMRGSFLGAFLFLAWGIGVEEKLAVCCTAAAQGNRARH